MGGMEKVAQDWLTLAKNNAELKTYQNRQRIIDMVKKLRRRNCPNGGNLDRQN